MRAMPRPLYRSRQFFGSLRPRVDPSLRDEATASLPEPARALFDSMTVRDQQHGLDVYRRLREAADHDPDLLAAALLHDCGKGDIDLWHRIAFVLLQSAAPALLRRVAREGDSASWRAALYRSLHHEDLGAKLALAAGCSDRIVALIRGNTSDPALADLHAADEAS
jgi:hypothetical protein